MIIKQLSKYVILAICAFILCGCPKMVYTDYGISPGYICYYYKFKRTEGDNTTKGLQYTYDKQNRKFVLATTWSAFYEYASAIGYIYRDRNDERAVYDELCRRYNDIYYNKQIHIRSDCGGKHDISIAGGGSPTAVCDTIVGIEIYTISGWDAKHKAGALLNDIFEIEYSTFTPYIASRYTLASPYTAVVKSLDELAENELASQLLDPEITLSTTSLPTISQSVNVVFELVSGEKIVLYARAVE